VYLRVNQLLPYERISELCGDLFGCPVSKATIETAQAQVDGPLEPFVEKVVEQMTEAQVATQRRPRLLRVRCGARNGRGAERIPQARQPPVATRTA
jgi:hypothetical protein